MFKVYISASTQNKNIGVNGYGTEEENMFLLANKVKDILVSTGKFQVFRNSRNWSLSETVADCNSKDCDIFIDNHTNSASTNAEGTEVFYYGQGGTSSKSFKLSSLLYGEIANVSIGKDRGLKADTDYFKTGLFVIQNTVPPSSLIEHFFHSNVKEVDFFKNNVDKFAEAEAKAICKYFGVDLKPIENEVQILKNKVKYFEDKFSELEQFVNQVKNYGGE